jgi:hypothetical protein
MGLLGKNGKAKVVCNLVRDEYPSYFLIDTNGKPQTAMAVTQTGPIFALFNKKEVPGVIFTSRPNAGSTCTFYDKDHQPRFLLGMVQNTPLISAFDADRSGLLFNVLPGARSQLALFSSGSPIWSATGAVPNVPELPPMDDMLREITR